MSATHEGMFLTHWEKVFVPDKGMCNVPVILRHTQTEGGAGWENKTGALPVWYTHSGGVKLTPEEMGAKVQEYDYRILGISFDVWMVGNGYLRIADYFYDGLNGVVVRAYGSLSLMTIIGNDPDITQLWMEPINGN